MGKGCKHEQGSRESILKEEIEGVVCLVRQSLTGEYQAGKRNEPKDGIGTQARV